ncbi:hypothetical protein C8R45DRAFT_920285 [Mycena sanguinolenta]|nr:hypothetical protein C8R45DRAFT_920285 [Mycena sanguinolenta]
MFGPWNRTPSALAFARALTTPPSATDYRGGLYGYTVADVLKTGRAHDPPIRKMQWCCQCRGEPQNWLPFYWQVLHAKKFEKYDLRKIGGVPGFIAIVEGRLLVMGWPVTRSILTCTPWNKMFSCRLSERTMGKASAVANEILVRVAAGDTYNAP